MKEKILNVVTSAQRPTKGLVSGSWIFDATLCQPLWRYNNTWYRTDGTDVNFPQRGTTANRPVLTTSNKGFQYFDTTLNRPIWWDGTKWVDATGADV